MFGDRREWARDLFVSGSAGIFLGLVGPFGSYLNPSRLVVLAYWIGALLFGAILFGLTVRPAVRIAPRLHLPATGLLLVALPVAAVPLALVCHAVASSLWPVPIGRIGLGIWYAQTLVISMPLALCYRLGSRMPQPARPAPSSTSFLQNLPPGPGRNLIALQMEDHYVRAHTAAGSTLILIPLHQAVAELKPSEGLRTHRSWWVARDAVTGVVRDGRNIRLCLSNGLQAPVSRTNIAAVREAGLLPDEL
jgi:hypothetical protein